MTRLWGLIWQGCWIWGHRWDFKGAKKLTCLQVVDGVASTVRFESRQCVDCGRWKAFRL